MRTSASFRTFSAVTILVLLALAGCTRRETPAEAGLRTGTLILGNGAEPPISTRRSSPRLPT